MKDYIELKTLKKLQGKRFPEFYMQSHMIGVPVLHIGRRNSKDRVIRTEKKAPGGKVVLCVNAKGIAQVTSPSLPTQKGGRTPARPTRDA